MPYTSDSWTFGHVPTTFKRLPTVNRWGVLHGFYSDQRDDQELSNSAPDMPSRVGFRILANRSIWRFPNIEGNLQTINGWIFSDTYGAISKIGGVDTTNIVQLRAQETRPKSPGIAFSAQASNSIYGSASTVQTAAMFVQCLIRYAA